MKKTLTDISCSRIEEIDTFTRTRQKVDAELFNPPPTILPHGNLATYGKHIFRPMISICQIFVKLLTLCGHRIKRIFK